MVEHRPRGAQEKEHVRGLRPPLPAPLRQHQLPVQQLPDTAGRPAGLQQIFVRPLPFLLVPQEGQVLQVQLHPPVSLRREGGSRRQRLVLGVVQLPEFS